MRFNDGTSVASDDLTKWDIKDLAVLTADTAFITAQDEHGEFDMGDMPMVDISDYCRDAAWDVLGDAGIDFDEWGMTITEVAEGYFQALK